MKSLLNPSLPSKFEKYFWDCDFNALNLKEHIRFITERLLVMGNEDAAYWIYNSVPQKVLNEIIENSRNIDSKTRNYWKIMLA